MASYSKSVTTAATVALTESEIKANQRLKSVAAGATAGVSVTPLRSRPYSKTVTVGPTAAVTVTVARTKVKTVTTNATPASAATVARVKSQSVSTGITAISTVVRSPSIFNHSVNEAAQPASGVFYRTQYKRVHFMYPPVGVNKQVSLKQPEFGNAHKLITQTIAKRARNGQLYLFKRSPSYEQMTMEFKFISETSFAELIQFMKDTAGQLVRYWDHKNQLWDGYIMTDPLQLSSLDLQGCNGDEYTVQIEFEGEKVS